MFDPSDRFSYFNLMTQTSPHAGTESARPRLTVLVADDEPMILRAIARILERRGHAVFTASDAHAARRLLEQHRFDVVVLDRRMPGDGLTVLRALDEEPSFAGTAILMTGGLATDPMEWMDLEVRYLQKPFRFSAVVPLVEQAGRH